MKLRDLDLSDKDLKDIAKKVVASEETIIGEKENSTGTKIEVLGSKLDARLGNDLVITIYFDKIPLVNQYSFRKFWGYHSELDIIGLDENRRRLSDKKLQEIVVLGLEAYIATRNNNPYGMVNIDEFSGDY